MDMKKNTIPLTTSSWQAWKTGLTVLCLSLLASFASAQRGWYVSPQGDGQQDGSSWANTIPLTDALLRASAGDSIYLLGYDQVDHTDKVYTVPADLDGFELKAGVRLYGGFAGTESSPDERERTGRGRAFEFRYRTVIVADCDLNDQYYPAGPSLIFPAPAGETDKRTDNASHVISLTASGNAAQPTEIDGVTIAAAHNTGGNGGGITVSGSGTYHIRNCFFLYNYAAQGGAIYVADGAGSDASTINGCYIMNNAAGTRSSQENNGGGIYLAGRGTVVNTVVTNNENGGILMSPQARVVQSTVVRNTAAAVELDENYTEGDIHILNTVIWGNSSLYENTDRAPGMWHCAYPEADPTGPDSNGNIYAGASNFDLGDAPPLFDNPAPKMGFNQDFNWLDESYPERNYAIRDGSVLIDAGGPLAELPAESRTASATDLTGITRPSGTAPDIGAYEHVSVESAHIRYVKQGATGNGTSWSNATGDLQGAIDELAALGGLGEVWVAAGTYSPTQQFEPNNPATLSFRMRDGISVYGGFPADAPDGLTRTDLTSGEMPWIYADKTILQGANYDGSCQWTNNYWYPTSESYHVVWFAPVGNEAEFTQRTILSGVTIQGGSAGTGSGTDLQGGGVYQRGAQTVLQNCVIRENRAQGNGGGVYLNGGRIEGCLVFKNSSTETDGGGIYVDTRGEVLRCMLTDNSAHNGSAVYMYCPENGTPGQMTLSTSVVSNNQSIENAAVYCCRGGSVVQSTIVNNHTLRATDAAMSDASQTGGLYLNQYGLVVNSVIWNNTNGTSGRAPFHALNPTAQTVRFFNTAVSNHDRAVWYNTLQQNVIRLSSTNSTADNATSSATAPDFTTGGATFTTDEQLEDLTGIQPGWTDVDYYWQPATGSNLRARGLPTLALPSGLLVTPEVDLAGTPLHRTPALGAHHVDAVPLQHSTVGDALRIYVNVDCQSPEHNGASWSTAYRSLNEAISYMAGLTRNETAGASGLEIYVLENEAIYPHYSYASDDPKSATIEVPAMQSGLPLLIKGGFPTSNTTDNTTDDNSDPLTYRSVIDGNPDGDDRSEGLYHCIDVLAGANVTFEGFHIINGNAAGEAVYHQGGGLLINGSADVTLRNCILENLSADRGAALYGEQANVTMENCVVNNNTNNTETAAVVIAQELTLRHVTFAQNIGGTYTYNGALHAAQNCFAAGNSSGNTDGVPEGFVSHENFQNPTNEPGATLGFNTYRGGYSSFRPLTSSTAAAEHIINRGTAVNDPGYDIMGNERDLGGTPDLGAYEADLPEAGTVWYVTPEGAGRMDGSSWENAIAGNYIYDMNRTSQPFYVTEGNDDHLVPTTDSRYIGFYDNRNRQATLYAETSGASKDFLETNRFTYSTRTYWDWNQGRYVTVRENYEVEITNTRNERYISGLQYAVEQATQNAPTGETRQVWVAAGTYTDYKGYVIRDRVEVYGGFPNSGSPGMNEREALVSQYIPLREEAIAGGWTDADKARYETILQVRDQSMFTRWNGYTPTVNWNGTGGYNDVKDYDGVLRKPVLFQPDVCLPTKAPGTSSHSHGDFSVSDDFTNTTRYERNANFDPNYVEYEGATWDGFTIRNGFYKEYRANRDGGAGVRMFRGVTLRNCVVTQNFNHSQRNRGGGIYCDGDNSYVINCFLLNNDCEMWSSGGSDSYGGGMYMIFGTGYNLLVANNSAWDGGGLFIENARFYNNTVAYNRATSNHQVGGLEQWKTDGIEPQLIIYNCLFYGNTGRALHSTSENKFETSYNCYIQTANNLSSGITGKLVGSTYGRTLANPFALGNNAQSTNNYRLLSGNWCVNNGYEGADLPDTDVDFTDRIKDCRVDVGAYELDNTENISPSTYTGSDYVTTATYYVTQNGNGSRSGENVANAACAEKLQDILDAAGEYVAGADNRRAIVKVAGYGADNGSFVYHPHDLSDPDDPQSYTYVVPFGVTLMGGYDETYTVWQEGSNPDCRDILNRPTVLSPVVQLTDGQTVNGYHAVTFGERPADYPNNVATTTIIDGITLSGGQALTTGAGNGSNNDKGGGAVVPAWGHVRNCIVSGNEALQGGGLYLQAGATVSGTLIKDNTAENGAGIYAANDKQDGTTAVTATSGTYIISTTVAANTSNETGGGIYLEDGAAVSLNSVFWGNDAPSDKDISGMTEQTYTDDYIGDVLQGSGTGSMAVYPFNSCYVEQAELPSTFEQNMSMTSVLTDYFANEETYELRAFSPLIKSGLPVDYQNNLAQAKDIAGEDINLLERVQTNMDRIDVGAFAFEGGRLSTDDYFTRLFVSLSGRSTEIPDDIDVDQYLGRSFYTPFSHLDEALEYIRKVRTEQTDAAGKTFEIFLAEGTYKPSYRRTDITGTVNDQRQNSFSVPTGVNLYGGFSGQELYSSFEQATTIDGTSITLTPQTDGDLDGILAAREVSDLNTNDLIEPWELGRQSILSGNINVSQTEMRAYHVVYSDGQAEWNGQSAGVTIDGVTIMDGMTSDTASEETEDAQSGRGGGIYASGVDYTLNRCRLLQNRAVKGNAIFTRNASLTLNGSMLAGNGPVDNPTVMTGTAGGGAAWVYGGTLTAFNTLWANNETTGTGGAVSVQDYNGPDGSLQMVNNTIVRNRSAQYAVSAPRGTIVNTLAWGNEYTDGSTAAFSTGTAITYSATEQTQWNSGQPDAGNHNISVSTDNNAVDGPRFSAPSATAGSAAFTSASRWNPAAISILTDMGDGMVAEDVTLPESEAAIPAYYEAATGAYKTAINGFYPTDGSPLRYLYIGHTGENNATPYLRYSGPKDEYGKAMDRHIDIGLYEYQYYPDFDKMDTIYVATQESGERDGTSWANATSDLRGAIIGLANATDDATNEPEPYNTVLIRQGTYYARDLFANGSAFKAYMQSPQEALYAKALSIRGSYNEQGVQDFAQPTVITPDESTKPATLLEINSTYGREVFVEGILFHNTAGNNIQMTTGAKDRVTLKDVQLRASQTGAEVTADSQGEQTLVNVLFADNKGTGLEAQATTTVINGTFAQNGTDFTGNPIVHNSASWGNTTQNLTTANTTDHNVAFAARTANEDIVNGPNFVDTENTDLLQRDYHIRPGITLLDKGADEFYEDFLRDYRYPGFKTDSETDEQFAQTKAAETDLGGTKRFVDRFVDVGAYEYGAPLRQIIYVNDRLATAGDGSSWENALTSLQDAVNLAGIFADNYPEKNYGYVFAQSTVGNGTQGTNLNVQLGGTKVYGGMHSERYSGTGTAPTDTVAGLLAQRRGMMESQGDHTQLAGLTIRAAQGPDRNRLRSVVDGFHVTGTATVANGGMLSTSVADSGVTLEADGQLYNSFVDGAVTASGTETAVVNVTATGTLPASGTAENNRSGVTETNRYINRQTDPAYNYQLNEKTDDIDGGTTTDISQYINQAGHDRDLAGNPRVLNGKPDNGCFETWSVPATAADAETATSWTTADRSSITYGTNTAIGKYYPAAGSVVYVNEGSSLIVGHTTESTAAGLPNPFSPGYLLLKEGASLYGNGKDIQLSYVATERTLGQGWNLAAVPYALQRTGIEQVTYADNGTFTATVLTTADSTETYNGQARAASLYRYYTDGSEFWHKGTTTFRACQGFALKAGTAGTYRFTAGAEDGSDIVYQETADEEEKTVGLTQYDLNEVNTDGTPNFTYKENMGWNLFGLPYLVSGYDLTKMDLPHVVYTMTDGSYATLQTWADGVSTQGEQLRTASPGEGIFTQTAIIGNGNTEQLRFPRPTSEPAGNNVNQRFYLLSLAGDGGEDGFAFTPTDEETDDEYVMGSDGLKLMSARRDAPQIYAVNRTGTRFSLMNAVDAAGTIQVGLRAAAGEYTLSLGETADHETAGEVWLTDHKTGSKVDLRQTDYRFSLTADTADESRFSLSFSALAERLTEGLNIYVRQRTLCVEGLREGDTVTLYTPSGVQVLAERCEGSTFSQTLKPGIYLVHVSGQRSARKVMIP